MVNKRINELANELSATVSQKNTIGWNEKFTQLFSLISPLFNNYYNQYINNNNLRLRNFDIDDYMSRFNMATYDAIIDYDINKGDFVNRLWYFCNKQFQSLTNYNFAQKRFSADLIYIDKYNIELFDTNNYNKIGKTIYEIVEDFIINDRHGKVVEILLSTESRNERHLLFKEYFNGSYGPTERKRVQRTRERLMEKLKEELKK